MVELSTTNATKIAFEQRVPKVLQIVILHLYIPAFLYPLRIYSCKISEVLKFVMLFQRLKLFTTQSRLLTTLYMIPFENIVGKGENATSIFSFFPQCFLPFPKQISIFQSNFFCRLQMLSIWTSLFFF